MKQLMKCNAIATLVIIILLFSCTDKKDRPATAVDTARLFIRSSLDGDFKNAEALLFNDTNNQQFFKTYELYYEKLPNDVKNSYKSADYQINSFTELNDSVVMVNYKNDYMNKPLELIVVRKNKEWFIDFKSSYSEK